MRNNHSMDSLALIETFQEVARRGSFSATARAQGVSPATVSKAIARLEERFGLRLLQRTTRKVSLTDAGQLLYERSAALLELINLTQEELQERATTPAGKLTLTAPHSLMQTGLPQQLGNFLQRNPAVSLELQVTNRSVNLAEDGVDLAFRVGAIPDQSIIVRRLLSLHYVAAATPDYWRRNGKPTHPEQLHQHTQLVYHQPGWAPRWSFHVDGKTLELPLNPRFSSSDQTPLTRLALQGLGVVWRPREALLEHLASDALETALEEFSPPDQWLYAAYLERRHNSAALRVLLQELQQWTQQLVAELPIPNTTAGPHH